MSVTIRRMAAADIDGVRQVARTTWAQTYQGIIPEPVQAEFLSLAYSDGALQRRMTQDVFLVAVRDGAIVGFADFQRTGPNLADLAAIYVLPAAQGAGVGSQLLTTGLRALPDVRTLQLHVERDNQIGRRFYAAKGFQISGETTEQFAGHDLHTLKMTLHCPPRRTSGRTAR
jgi:ribosomal protein S18 acetylase RimI-like enzyme